ncbi:MAG: 16S rRNA (guanine(966)-N(2))-methyltransferase RsmD [Terracidiphilus sp.]|jgi:16S rRNA (guanine(966)-N(2))-methyltransferase RsmD
MRIVAGTFRSRKLEAPAGLATRPTSDRLRETLFNVLAPRIEGARFLDLYAGSGAVGIEALSRGAAGVVFVERAPAALAAVRKNLAILGIGVGTGISAGIRIQPVSVISWLRKPQRGTPLHGAGFASAGVGDPSAFDLVFLDPPYEAVEEYSAALGLLGGAAAGLLAQGALVIAEHRSKAGRKERLEERYGSLQRTRLLEQGDAALSFYAVLEAQV